MEHGFGPPYTGNKHMPPIANKPMLMFGLEQLRTACVREIGVVLGSLREGIIDVLGDGPSFNVRITYIDQPDPRGPRQHPEKFIPKTIIRALRGLNIPPYGVGVRSATGSTWQTSSSQSRDHSAMPVRERSITSQRETN